MPADLEKWTKKILKLISVEGNAVICNFKSISIAAWNSWRRDALWVEMLKKWPKVKKIMKPVNSWQSLQHSRV